MNLYEIFIESIIVLKTNKLRTGLSALGIIIGIGSVISLMSLGSASQKSIQERIQTLGSNLLTIRPGSSQQGFLRQGGGSSETLTIDDAIAIKNTNRITGVKDVASEYSSRAQISNGASNTNTQVVGITESLFSIRNIEVEIGNGITEIDNNNRSNVAVIGAETAANLFVNEPNVIGKQIRINGTSFVVNGVVKSKGSGGFGNNDDIVYIPLSTAQKVLFGVDHVSNIYISIETQNQMEAAQNQIGFFLLERHNLKTPEEADFSIFSQNDILETANQVTATFTTLLTGIAAISLVVGGIGIMNIMLVTVTERTREIGLLKALGAKRKTIITQFLVESVILTLVGGMIGVAIGVAASLILTKFMSLPQSVSTFSIFLALIVSCFIGIVFGWYPAYRASKLQPIEALRYE